MRPLVWILVWLVLLGLAGWFLWRRVRGAWRASSALGEQLAEVEVLAEAARQVAQERAEAAAADRARVPVPEPAVFRDPALVGAEREALRRTLREQRDARRAQRLPGWARRVESADADERKA